MILGSLLAVGLVLAGCAPASVEDEIAAINERIDTLEKQVQSLPGGGQSARLEEEAQIAFTQLLNQLVANAKLDEAKQRLEEYSNKYASTKYASRFRRLGAELSVVGKASPQSWGVEKWFQGQEKIDLDGDGTMVLVFWETWCPHCKREVPKLQEMYDRLKDQGLQMVGFTRLNRGATEEAVREIITEHSLAYPMAKEDGSLTQYFAVSGVPAAAVVKGRKVVWRGHPARLNDAMLKSWLAS
jgi:thiol-disulfide isomerase/thioredoxin